MLDNEKMKMQGQRLQNLIIHFKMTTRDLAKMIGLSENTLYKINSGLNEMSDRTAAKICYFLSREKGVSVNRQWLLTGDGTMLEGKEVKQYERKEEPMPVAAEESVDFDVDYKKKYFLLLEEYSKLQAEYSALLKKMLQ